MNEAVFRVEENVGELAALAALAADLLTPEGWLLYSTNCRNRRLDDFQKPLRHAIPRPMSARHSPMPAEFTDEPYLKSVWLKLSRQRPAGPQRSTHLG